MPGRCYWYRFPLFCTDLNWSPFHFICINLRLGKITIIECEEKTHALEKSAQRNSLHGINGARLRSAVDRNSYHLIILIELKNERKTTTATNTTTVTTTTIRGIDVAKCTASSTCKWTVCLLRAFTSSIQNKIRNVDSQLSYSSMVQLRAEKKNSNHAASETQNKDLLDF